MLRDLIIAHLKAQVPSLKKVGMAMDLNAAMNETKQFPCAFVMSIAETGAANRYMTGAVAQKRTQRIAVLLAVRNVRDATGQAADTDMDALRSQTDAALFGWQANDTHSPLVFSAGKIMGLINGNLWWQDEYTTEFDRRQ
jgi:hypothetical protein